jgi:uncharacterized protein YrrD
MLRSKDIIGLPIFTIAEGKEIGKITEILVNPSRGVVAALAVENTTQIVTYSSIKNIGKDAVMIDSTSQLLEISEHKSIERWKDIKIIDSKVVTSSGRYLGQVNEFLLDSITGKILSCMVSNLEGERVVIPASRIVTFGKDALIVVDEEVEEVLGIEEEEEAAEMEEVLHKAKEEKKAEREEIKTILEQLAEEIEKEPEKPSEKPASEVTPQTAPTEKISETISPPAESKPKPEEPMVKTKPLEEAKPSLEEKTEAVKTEAEQEEKPTTREQIKETVPPELEERAPLEQLPKPTPEEIKTPEEQIRAIMDKHQHDFLLGKTVKKDLLADDGTLILKAGETITEDVLEKAKKANKYLELGFYV